MQSLAGTTIRPPSQAVSAAAGRPQARAAVNPVECARAMLDGLPPVMWFIRRHMRRHRKRGLSVPQFRTLVLLSQYPAASVSAVAEHLGSSLPSASRLVGGLVSWGLVARQACLADRRQVSLVLTPQGRAVFTAAKAETQDRIAAAVARMNEAERATVAEAMRLLQALFSTPFSTPPRTSAQPGTSGTGGGRNEQAGPTDV